MPEARRSKSGNVLAEQPEEYLELLANWTDLYAGNFVKEPDESTILGYRIGLSDLRNLKVLDLAFLRCFRECTFWPTVAELHRAYHTEAQDMPLRTALPAADDSMTPEERAALHEKVMDTLRNLPEPKWTRLPSREKGSGLSIVISDEMRAKVERDKEELRKRYPEAFNVETKKREGE